MSHARAEAVDELIHHELAIHQALIVLLDLFSEFLEEVSLHLAERFCSRPAVIGEVGMSVLPLGQLLSALTLSRSHVGVQFLEGRCLAFLTG